jgi:ribosomal protein L33
MRFSTNDIVIIDESKFLDINQNKTDAPVLIYLNEVVLNIIKKHHGDFPPLFSLNSKESNEIIYNKLIKLVCKQSGITNLITSQIKNKFTNRLEVKKLEKYKFVSSHIGRRSYASNYYGDISTSLLLSATGHKTEKQFLVYVSKPPKQNARALAMAMRELSEKNQTPFKVIKNIS